MGIVDNRSSELARGFNQIKRTRMCVVHVTVVECAPVCEQARNLTDDAPLTGLIEVMEDKVREDGIVRLIPLYLEVPLELHLHQVFLLGTHVIQVQGGPGSIDAGVMCQPYSMSLLLHLVQHGGEDGAVPATNVQHAARAGSARHRKIPGDALDGVHMTQLIVFEDRAIHVPLLLEELGALDTEWRSA